MKSFLTHHLALYCLILFGTSVVQAVEASPTNTTTSTLPSLAVLVHAEPGGEALAEPLRALLEVETSQRYEGALLERAEIATVLQELKLSSLLGADQPARGWPGVRQLCHPSSRPGAGTNPFRACCGHGPRNRGRRSAESVLHHRGVGAAAPAVDAHRRAAASPVPAATG